MKILISGLGMLFILGLGALYGGVAWVIAWILDKGLDVNVNYTIFVWVGIAIYLLKLIPVIIAGSIARKQQKKFDEEFKSLWRL